jgi:hypothetical protein
VLNEITNVEVEASGAALSANGGAGTLTYACNDKGAVGGAGRVTAVTLVFSRAANVNGNTRVQMVATAETNVQGTVDGDLGALLTANNLASTAGVNHPISGIRIRR